MRYCFITGVSRGLGRSLVQAATSPDAKIVGFGRSRGDFAGEFHSCDFSKPQLAFRIFEDALAAEDLESATEIVFINNAGTLGPLDFAQKLDPIDIEQTIAANLCGAAIAASCFLRRVQDIACPKVFAQISSGAAQPERAKPGWSLYCAAKAGQEQLVRSIALEQTHAAHPCAFINIDPGVMETAMQEAIRATPPTAFPEVERFIRLKQDGLLAAPENVAQQIRQLLAQPAALDPGKTYRLS